MLGELLAEIAGSTCRTNLARQYRHLVLNAVLAASGAGVGVAWHQSDALLPIPHEQRCSALFEAC